MTPKFVMLLGALLFIRVADSAYAAVTDPAATQVQTLNNSNHVVNQVKSYQPDVILMDNWIPGPGGIEATKLLKMAPETMGPFLKVPKVLDEGGGA